MYSNICVYEYIYTYVYAGIIKALQQHLVTLKPEYIYEYVYIIHIQIYIYISLYTYMNKHTNIHV